MLHPSKDIDVSTAIQPRSPLITAATVLIALMGIGLVSFLVFNPRFEWPIVARYLFAPTVLKGLGVTILLTALAMAIGTVIGTVMALLLIGKFGPGRWMAATYLWLFRATPPLIQLIFWYNLAYLVPRIPVGLPFMEPLWVLDANRLITPFVAALLGLGLVAGAYMTEIVRAGLLSVDKAQHEAAKTIGMAPVQAFFRIIAPQAMRFIMPPAGNQVITMAKATSLVSVIAMNDLLHSVQLIYNRTFEVIPLLLVAVIWFLVLIGALTVLQKRVERYYSRGYVQTRVIHADPEDDDLSLATEAK
ncbi:MAG: amino acid ABC transporter permease [Pseudodonghicola sp.]